MTDESTVNRNWRRTARGRLRFELSGIAFAKAHGLTPEDWSAFLWGARAQTWMKDERPAADEYLAREAEAFGALYPAVRFERGEWTGERATLHFTRGCLGGWGRDRWGIARSLGLGPEDVCRYCAESFRLWGAQLGIVVEHQCDVSDGCTLTAHRADASGKQLRALESP